VYNIPTILISCEKNNINRKIHYMSIVVHCRSAFKIRNRCVFNYRSIFIKGSKYISGLDYGNLWLCW